MSVFRVWAPTAERVDVQLGSEAMGGAPPQPMRPAATPGWWEADVPEAAASGTDYVFRVDGGEPLPDPRSPWQPLGSEGPGRPGPVTRIEVALVEIAVGACVGARGHEQVGVALHSPSLTVGMVSPFVGDVRR